jgi:hypothetical protein
MERARRAVAALTEIVERQPQRAGELQNPFEVRRLETERAPFDSASVAPMTDPLAIVVGRDPTGGRSPLRPLLL